MTLNDFQASIVRTYRPGNIPCHGLGIAGEAGEVADLIKKQLFHGRGELETRDNMRHELGDVLWYVAAVANDYGLALDDIAQGNIDKLAARYPKGFVKGGGVRASAPNDMSAQNCGCDKGANHFCQRHRPVVDTSCKMVEDCVRGAGHFGSHRRADGSVF